MVASALFVPVVAGAAYQAIQSVSHAVHLLVPAVSAACGLERRGPIGVTFGHTLDANHRQVSLEGAFDRHQAPAPSPQGHPHYTRVCRRDWSGRGIFGGYAGVIGRGEDREVFGGCAGVIGRGEEGLAGIVPRLTDGVTIGHCCLPTGRALTNPSQAAPLGPLGGVRSPPPGRAAPLSAGSATLRISAVGSTLALLQALLHLSGR
eukprot:191548-Prorocentrum_minimum.AAC.1